MRRQARERRPGRPPPTLGIAPVLSVPVFIVVLALARLLAAGLEAAGLASLRPLLALQFLLLAGFLALRLSAGSHINPDAPNEVLAAMLGVSAMAVQNTLVQISVRGAPSTAVVTTDITRFTMDVGQVLLGRDPAAAAAARRRAAHTWPAIVGFGAGAALGAALFRAVGPPSIALPTGLALLALAGVHRGKTAPASQPQA
jgi:uncharacterized membrane protein YoaK (UPF0700 family)